MAISSRVNQRGPRHGGAAFWLVHLACLAAFFTGVTWSALAVCLALFWLRMFGVTAGYHRYFSHRSYKTSRPFQFVLALLGTLAVQKGVLWWAANHRQHHKYSDQEGRHSLARAARLLVVARRLDPGAGLRRHRPRAHPGHGDSIPSCAG